MDIRIVRIGTLGTPLVVIDQPLADPDRWRTDALSGDWALRGEYYPGPRAPAPAEYIQALAEPLRFALGQVYRWRSIVDVERCYYALAVAPADQLSLAQRIPHVDSYDPAQIAFVHYLCDARFGGTAFYRQRSTGFERIDEGNSARFETALEADFARLGEPTSGYVTAASPTFEQLERVEAAYNRIVLFPGNQLHCADLDGAPLNPDPAAGRMTVTGFLRPGS